MIWNSRRIVSCNILSLFLEINVIPQKITAKNLFSILSAMRNNVPTTAQTGSAKEGRSQRREDKLGYLLENIEIVKIGHLIISQNPLHFLISIDSWPVFQKPSLRPYQFWKYNIVRQMLA